jgi:hypothetical protein
MIELTSLGQSRRRRWLPLALVPLLGLLAILYVAWTPTDLQRRFAQIQLGMSREQAVAILGPPLLQENYTDEPAKTGNDPRWAALWGNDREYASLVFSEDNRVVKSNYKRLTVLENARRMWQETFGSKAPF